MIKMPWPELKEKLLSLPKSLEPVKIERLGVITNEENFIRTHIAVVERATKKENLTLREKHFKLHIAAPHYQRLLAYYILKTQL